jgi:hypothetical protein
MCKGLGFIWAKVGIGVISEPSSSGRFTAATLVMSVASLGFLKETFLEFLG